MNPMYHADPPEPEPVTEVTIRKQYGNTPRQYRVSYDNTGCNFWTREELLQWLNSLMKNEPDFEITITRPAVNHGVTPLDFGEAHSPDYCPPEDETQPPKPPIKTWSSRAFTIGRFTFELRWYRELPR